MKKEKGFTLIELIAVLVILAILALIVTPLMLNIIKKVKISANKRSIDAYGKAAELAIANYMQEKRDYPSSFNDVKVEYTGKEVKCKVFIFNDDVDGSIYLSGCSVDGVEVLDNSTVDGYYHYGNEGLNDRYHVSTYGMFVEKAVKEYIEKNSVIPNKLTDLTINYDGKNVSCNRFEMTSNQSFFISECSVNGDEVLDESTPDGYYHYGKGYKEYKIGDMVTYNGINFYVIENSNYIKDSVTLLKAEPLTVDEVNTYGIGHINKYAYSSVGTAYDLNGYGAMAYYTSETCGSIGSGGCIKDYETSEVKYAVDAWVTGKLNSSDLTEDSLGYKARLLSIEELTNNFAYKKDGSSSYANHDIEKTAPWLCNDSYNYWTMGAYYVGGNGYVSTIVIDAADYSVVRPVITLLKSAI